MNVITNPCTRRDADLANLSLSVALERNELDIETFLLMTFRYILVVAVVHVILIFMQMVGLIL